MQTEKGTEKVATDVCYSLVEVGSRSRLDLIWIYVDRAGVSRWLDSAASCGPSHATRFRGADHSPKHSLTRFMMERIRNPKYRWKSK